MLARGDQLLLMPTARRMPPGTLRGELWTNHQLAAGSLALGLTQTWEAQVSVDQFGANPGRVTGSVGYYYLSPIADITPGLSGGILDVANTTTDGRRLYVCATMNRSLPKLEKYGYAELTAGFEVGRRSGPMAGIHLPFARSLSVLGEYDGARFNFGFEANLSAAVYTRLALRAGTAYAVVGFRL